MSEVNTILLRPVGPDDEAFLFELYASTRQKELELVEWSEEVRARFLRQQFDAQRAHYAAAYPNAVHSIILRDNRPAGRIWIERNAGEIRILDMTIHAADRGAGIGSHLLREAMREARQTALPLRHSVEKNNLDAMRLYNRLGFLIVSEIPTHYFMEYSHRDDA
ncbi:MAG: GNAT family N-acetyltransferase [Pyrinomonadaceae bacterium]